MKDGTKNYIDLPRTAIEITTRCNLKCKFCAVGIPTQREAIHLSLEDVQSYLRRLFEIVDHTNSLEFTGGEPLLHNQLSEMIHSYMEYKQKFNRFLIVTNGTVPLNTKLKSVLEMYKDHGIIHISDYGLYPERTEKLISDLQSIDFPYRVDKYWGEEQYQGGWVDPGALASHERSHDQLINVFSNCGLVLNGGCWRVHKGQLHFCERSCRCSDEGYIFPDEFIDLLDQSSTISEKRAKLCAIRQAKYLNACNYCNGLMGTKDKSKRIPAGIQVDD